MKKQDDTKWMVVMYITGKKRKTFLPWAGRVTKEYI